MASKTEDSNPILKPVNWVLVGLCFLPGTATLISHGIGFKFPVWIVFALILSGPQVILFAASLSTKKARLRPLFATMSALAFFVYFLLQLTIDLSADALNVIALVMLQLVILAVVCLTLIGMRFFRN